MRVFLLATLDTKGEEAEWVRQQLLQAGVHVTLVDTGCLGAPRTRADITREDVFRAAGVDWQEVGPQCTRGQAVEWAAKGAAEFVARAWKSGQVAGVLGIGGSAGTMIATSAMRGLPVGIPKLMVSTLASGDVHAYVGSSDILMLHSVVDIAGLNRISRTVLSEAAAAMAGMVRFRSPQSSEPIDSPPLIAATMFGVTTPCVEVARRELEAAGYEVLVFHATGSGGQAMESLIRDGWIAGVLDLTTTEMADLLVGGVMSAGPHRLTAAAQQGIPQVVSVGATDMVNFWALETVPPAFRSRRLHVHNPQVTLMRTTAEECAEIGRAIANRLAAASGPYQVLLPLQGVSALDQTGQPFEDGIARQALFHSIREGLPTERVTEVDAHLNDAPFAQQAAQQLIQLMKTPERKRAT